MDSPMYRAEGFVAIYLALAFSFIPAIALPLILDSKDTFYKADFIFADNHTVNISLKSVGN